MRVWASGAEAGAAAAGHNGGGDREPQKHEQKPLLSRARCHMSDAALADVQRRADDAKAVMADNVNVMVENVDKANVLEDRSANLAVQASAFQSTARDTKNAFWRQLMRERLCIVGCVLGLIIVIILIAVGASGGFSGGGGGGSTSPTTMDPPSPPMSPPTPGAIPAGGDSVSGGTIALCTIGVIFGVGSLVYTAWSTMKFAPGADEKAAPIFSATREISMAGPA